MVHEIEAPSTFNYSTFNHEWNNKRLQIISMVHEIEALSTINFQQNNKRYN